MKALKYFTMFLQVILICPFFASAADTISGTVTDSLSGKAIPLVTVKIASPSCSTYTDSQGRYSFTISTTRTIRELPQISWNAGGFSISGYAGYAGITGDRKTSGVFPGNLRNHGSSWCRTDSKRISPLKSV